MKGYPRGFVKALIGIGSATWVSGALLAPNTFALRTAIELPWQLPGAARVGVTAAHAGSALALVFVCGALWSVHMRSGWRHSRQRISGVAMAGLLVVLAGTSLAVLYAGSGRVADGSALLHLGTGLALALPFGWHRAHGRRRSAARALIS